MNNNVRAIDTMAIKQDYEQVTQDVTNAGLIGFDKTVSAINNGASAAHAGFEKSTAQVKQNMEKAIKVAEEMVSFSQGNYEAFVKSSQIWVAGVQDLSKQFAATAQAQFEETISAFKSLTSVKSLKEAVDLQTSLARTSLEKAMTESGRFTDASIKLAEQTMAPLTARVTLAVEKFAKPV